MSSDSSNDECMGLQIKSEELETVLSIIRLYCSKVTVWAFGSRVTRKASRYSDLDLVFIGQGRINDEIIISLKDSFTASSLPFRVDVLDWSSLDEGFKEIVKKSYVEIWKGE